MQNIMLFPKNILFDLGGVILNLDIPRTMACFKSLAGSEEEFNRIFAFWPKRSILSVLKEAKFQPMIFWPVLSIWPSGP